MKFKLPMNIVLTYIVKSILFLFDYSKMPFFKSK